jgi:tetratricopeptide (TPR) repeat protein
MNPGQGRGRVMTMTRIRQFAFAAAMAAAIGAPAWAWGPRAQVAMVTTAAEIITKQEGIALANLRTDIRDGASLGSNQLAALVPGWEENPTVVIQSQMDLLQSMRGDRIDPYYAYRLGVLGKLVARETAPLSDANPAYRDLYYRDVEENISRVRWTPMDRRVVDPGVYFAEAQSEADRNADVILRDYQEGVGFRGMAASQFPDDASRSIAAVSDVWWTILRGPAVASAVSAEQMREYYLDAMKFYVRRDNTREIDAAYARIVDRNIMTPDFQKELGDAFFEGELYDRAIPAYEAVLAEAPGRRDVIERISEYYLRMGDLAMKEGRLEDGFKAFQSAVNADKLNTDAQLRLFDAEEQIAARDMRRAESEAAIETAQAALRQSEQLMFAKRYTDAMRELQQAKQLFASVSGEFSDLSTTARSGELTAETRMSQVRGDIINNSPNLSGVGARASVMRQAQRDAAQLNQEALRALTEKQLEAALQELRRDNSDLLP